MGICTSRRLLVGSFLALVGAVVVPARQIGAAEHVVSAEEARAAVDLFPAISANQVEVTIIPRSSKSVRLQVENKTDKPLTIRLPAAFVAMPVLAQNLGAGNFLGGNQQGNQQGNNPFGNGSGGGGGRSSDSQALGGAGGGPGGNPFGGQNNPRGGNRPPPGGLFNVAAGKVAKLTLPSVCLEYGKRDPYPRIPYEIRPLESFTDSTAVRELLEAFGDGHCSQEIAQLAAWHLSNNMSWEDMANLTVRRAAGHTELRFDRVELQQAKQLVEGLPSHKAAKSVATPVSLSRK